MLTRFRFSYAPNLPKSFGLGICLGIEPRGIVSNQAWIGGACCWPELRRWETRLSWGCLGVGGEQQSGRGGKRSYAPRAYRS
ncbi:MAG: hypothetical protein ACRC8Y_15365 [Chroococcales cyanobacterium]